MGGEEKAGGSHGGGVRAVEVTMQRRGVAQRSVADVSLRIAERQTGVATLRFKVVWSLVVVRWASPRHGEMLEALLDPAELQAAALALKLVLQGARRRRHRDLRARSDGGHAVR